MPTKFVTPLSTQRYIWVQNYLEQHRQLTSLTDVGCGNGRMLAWTKTMAQLETINCLDIDELMLQSEMERNFRPNLLEMLFGRQNSDHPLNIHVFQGDAVVPDERLQADCFSLIEFIEYLTPERLADLSRTIFSYYKPKCVIVSTPNADMSQALREHPEIDISDPNLPKRNYNSFGQFNYKVERTRAEFNQWAQTICHQYNYTFHSDGVGDIPELSGQFGLCTQIAAFHIRPTNESDAGVQGDLACFDLLLNKLTVQERRDENLGDLEAKRICLMSSFKFPGHRMDTNPPPEPFDWTTLADDKANPQKDESTPMEAAN